MTQEALRMALDALEGFYEYGYDRQECFEHITAIKEALAQPEQEPVTYSGNGTAGREADVRPTGFFFQMPKPVGEVYGWHGSGKGQPMCRFNATEEDMPIGTQLYTAPPKPEQEPVANIRTWHKNGEQHAELWNWDKGIEALPDGDYDLYTRPQAREWVGLTDEERQACINYRAVEAKLKEKNT